MHANVTSLDLIATRRDWRPIVPEMAVRVKVMTIEYALDRFGRVAVAGDA